MVEGSAPAENNSAITAGVVSLAGSRQSPNLLSILMRLKLGSALAAGVSLAVGSLALQSGDAQAATCLLSNLAGCNITIGDYQFSDFSFTGFSANPNDFFELLSPTVQSSKVSLQFSPQRQTPSDVVAGSFTYKIALLEGRTFSQGQSQIDAALLGSGTTTLSSPPFSATFTGTSTGSSPLVAFTPGLTAQTFTQSFNFDIGESGGSLSNVTGVFTSTARGTSGVPGPLPILGAAAAFRLSRRMRNRIKATV